MDDQDTQATEPTSPQRARDVAVGAERDETRDQEAPGSPVPDPTERGTAADEIPEAD